MIDYPDEVKQSDAVKKQNAKLEKHFQIQAFPTLYLLDAKGRPFAEAEMEMEVKGHLEQLSTLVKVRATRDEKFAAAAKLEGVEKAKALNEALQVTGFSSAALSNFYQSEVEELTKNDPEDKTGFVKAAKAEKAFAKMEEKIDDLFDADNDKPDLDAMVKVVDDFVKTHSPKGKLLQESLMTKSYLFEEKGDTPAALKALDEAIKVDPKSELAGYAKEIKAELAKGSEKKPAE